MRLDFNILWVEDQPERAKSYCKRIEFLLRKEGFRLQTEVASSVEEAKGYLGSDIYGDHIDLVVMDYDLGAGPTGEDGLVEVRSVFAYKDVVFYSADANKLGGIVAKRQFPGVYCADRTTVPDVVHGVFSSLVKKVLDIDHSRGVIMGSSSDIDGLVFDCLSAHFSAAEDILSSDARAVIADRLKEIRQRFHEDAAKVEAAAKVQELLDLHAVYTSVDRLNLLRKILQAEGKHGQACALMKKYVGDVVPKRNILAHVRVERKGFSRKLFDRKGKEFTSDDVKGLRQALLLHQEAFEELVKKMGAK